MTDKVQKIRKEVERLRSLHQMKYQQLDADSSMSLVECGKRNLCNELLSFIDSLQEEPISIWHDASEEPDDMSHCLIFYGCKESVGHYLHYEPVLYNKKEKVFVTPSFPHPTGYKVEQKSIDGGCVAEVYKNKRDRISSSDITQWCYLCDLHNLSNVERTVKNWKEPVSEDLEEAAREFIEHYREVSECGVDYNIHPARVFKAGAKWQKAHNWKPADGDDLPKIDREVIVLIQDYPDDKDHLRVALAHRPRKYAKVWNSDLGEEQVVEIERYDKGCWNIPNVKWWLDIEKLPNMDD